ncbi:MULTISPECIES: hypothetical protein [unclassified Nocardiopsis]|uniref:hypothetical protein n=1 Tax=unclassified Nocardiopsis TaxID=2649073 RepID=UPI00135AE7CA|nr:MULTISPECIES: hypothetical protein [unclassified Nocardiopsis]
MTSQPPSYPVVEERALGAPVRHGFLGLRGRRRDPSELPRASAHQVLVYRSGGAFHVDKGGLALDDSRVVDADHVCLVDVSHDVSVSVDLTVPSLEDDDFEVRTTFFCTVLDPVTVVSEGRGDAHRFLSGYMRRYDKLPQIAQHLRLEDINEVRELVWSHVKAFIDLSPPEVRGMRIEYVGTEVLTPHSLREVRGTWRATRHEQEVEVARTDHDHLMKEKVTEHTRRIMAGLSESVQNDTINAIMLALADGSIAPTEVANRISAERDRALNHEAQREAAEREERLLRLEREREEALRRETWAREDEHRRMQIRSQLAQTAIRENYVDGSMTTAQVVGFVASDAPLPGGSPLGAERRALDGTPGGAAAPPLTAQEEDRGSGEVWEDGGGPGRRRTRELSEDDHDV